MKTDRELLELAAKASGISLVAWSKVFDEWKFICNPCGEPWNPLIDDGDALRLAVKLGIVIDTSYGVHVQYIVDGVARPISEYEYKDIYSATRRAIVRAAAEIGEANEKVEVPTA